MEPPKSVSRSGVGYRQCSRDKMPRRDPQAMHLPRPFSKAMRSQFLNRQKSITVHKVCSTSNFVWMT
eukprot:4717063-Ditylum_brightwellii.AAC.2